ncbi:MAG TPA: hypothetical protein VFB62_15010 [Polyangiaceae bacterium]|jgi:hypothetical protein|nr:hypothetical protein [Polyangiaceae bacterium]
MVFVPRPLLVMSFDALSMPVGLAREQGLVVIKLTFQLDDASEVSGCLFAAEQLPLEQDDFSGPRGELSGPLGTGRMDELAGDETLRVSHVTPRYRAVRLPGLVPHAEWTDGDLGSSTALSLSCDALRIDPERRSLVARWCGRIPEAPGDRLLVSLGRVGDTERSRPHELARAHLRFASERSPIEIGDEELALEQYALQSRAPEPRLTLERFAAISAALAEQHEPRAATLARHGIAEADFALEERAWIERIAQRSLEGDVSLALAFGESFLATQDALQEPHELDAMIHEYVAVRARLERGEDPTDVLESWNLRLSEWMRLDRHWRRRAARDRKLGAELERALAEEARA